jgi:hypothetical protein
MDRCWTVANLQSDPASPMSDYSTVHLNDPEDNHSHIQPDSVKSAGNARKAEGSEFGQPRFDAATESQKPPPYPTSAPPHRDQYAHYIFRGRV